MIKLIGSDIDGTLVSEGAHRIDPQYYEVIRELKELGIRFCACSGRQYPSMRELFAPVADDIYFISNSGTLIRTTERELFSWSIKPEICLPLIRKIKSIEGMNLIVGLSDVTLIDAEEGSEFLHFVRDEYHYTIRKVEDLSAIDPEGVIEVSMYCDNVQSVAEKLKKDPAFSDLLWSVSGVRWCDITAKEAGKGEAFALLLIVEAERAGQQMVDLILHINTGHEAGFIFRVDYSRYCRYVKSGLSCHIFQYHWT